MAQDLTAANPGTAAVRVTGPADTHRAAESASALAASIGFDPAACHELALVAIELGTNLVRHASGGTLLLSRVEAEGRNGIRIESEDRGPGIADVEQAIADGYSTAGGLGVGLGAVNRLMDDLDVFSRPEGGAHLICQRWLRPKVERLIAPGLEFGAATRSYHCDPENGDSFLVRKWGRFALAGVIDGLGHGQFARKASQTARQYIEQHFDQPLDSLFRGTGRACRATRGVVMALARFDLARERVTCASVGNIEVRLIGSPDRFNLVVRRGIIGLNAPNPVPSEYAWTNSSLMVMHSDGIRTQWAPNDFPDLWDSPPGTIAHRMLTKLGKTDDDATVVVARNSRV